MDRDNGDRLMLQWGQGLNLERDHGSGVRQAAKNQGIHGSQIIKQSCGAESVNLGVRGILGFSQAQVQKLELEVNVKIGGIINVSQGIPDQQVWEMSTLTQREEDCLSRLQKVSQRSGWKPQLTCNGFSFEEVDGSVMCKGTGN